MLPTTTTTTANISDLIDDNNIECNVIKQDNRAETYFDDIDCDVFENGDMQNYFDAELDAILNNAIEMMNADELYCMEHFSPNSEKTIAMMNANDLISWKAFL